MTTLSEKIPGLIDMYKTYKRIMDKDGMQIRPRDFKRALLLRAGSSIDNKKRNFCLRYVFTLFY